MSIGASQHKNKEFVCKVICLKSKITLDNTMYYIPHSLIKVCTIILYPNNSREYISQRQNFNIYSFTMQSQFTHVWSSQ